MADPISLTTMAAISLGTTAAGGIIGAKGAADAGSAQAAMLTAQGQQARDTAAAQGRMYTYQAGVAEMNRKIAEENATYAIALGETKAQLSGMETRATMAKTKASQGASGIDVNTGTNVAVRESEAEIGAYEQDVARADAAKESYNQKVKAWEAGTQADLYRMSAEDAKRAGSYANMYDVAASNARRAGNINAATSILGAASSVSTRWMQFSKQGVPGF